VAIALVAGSSFAASGDDFYDGLYRRGISHFNDGKYEAARRELQIAAFGLIESIPRYETAHAYLIATARQLKLDGEARISLQRILNAEKVERRYASLTIPAPVRQLVDSAARALLTKEEAASLRERAGAVQAAAMDVAPAAPAPQASGSTPADAVVVSAASADTAGEAPAATPDPQPIVAPPLPPQPAPPLQPSAAPLPSPAPTTIAPPPSQPATPKAAPPPQPQPASPPPANKVITPPSSTSPDGWKMPAPAPLDIAAQFRTADAATTRGDLVSARAAYRSVLAAERLSHADALRLAEGLYRSRDFAGVVTAFARAGTIGRGEEPYRYYLAVALYETGRYAAAKRELEAVMPFIEVTPDVARYGAKIAAAIE
jgi:tetratricopeptide (TPR) repeat protein